MADFRNITSLAEDETPSFAEYEFEGEGFEDFGSWNPVSIDDIITNCQQFELDDEKTRSLGALRSAATGPTLSVDSDGAFDFRDDQMRGVVGNDAAPFYDDSQIEWNAPKMMGGHGMAVQQPATQWMGFGGGGLKHIPKRPTCYAPLFPVVHMPTHFKTQFELEVTVSEIERILQEIQVSFRFIASECTWNCSYLNNASHGSFVVRVYRFPAKLGVKSIHHAVEMQRLDGDAWIFRSIYEALHDALSDPEVEEAVSIWPKPLDDRSAPAAAAVPATPVSDAETLVKAASQLSETVEADGSSSFQVPSMENLKQVIVATLQHGRLSAVVESTQLACSIYSEEELLAPTEVDVACMKELMKIVNESETNSDWASQHAVWALTSMSRRKDYCEKILSETGDLGIEFLQAIFALAVPGNFSTQGMRCKCVELLENLLEGDDEGQVVSVLGEGNIHAWQQSEFVREAKAIGIPGKSIG